MADRPRSHDPHDDDPNDDPDPDSGDDLVEGGDAVDDGPVGGADAGGDPDPPDGRGDDLQDWSGALGDVPGFSGADFDLHGESLPLDDHESALVEQDLVDLHQFEATFRADGYRGVSVFCRDCQVEHYYPWDLLRENLNLLLETGETPVHEPAFDPDPADYVPWDYARGYSDALADSGVGDRRPVEGCPSCGLTLPDDWDRANFCPRCATPLLAPRLVDSLTRRGLGTDDIRALLHEMGLPG